MKKNNLIGIILTGTVLCSFTGLIHNINLNTNKNTVLKNTVLLAAPTTSTNSNPGNWISNAGHWYYKNLKTNTNETGWQTIDGHVYYFNDQGIMQTGWHKEWGATYYFNTNGTQATGWQTIDGHVYYFNGQGIMQIGWHKQWGATYYFNANGAQATGWQTINGNVYYFNSQGVMHTGWYEEWGATYYFNPNGTQATGWQTIDGNVYDFNSQGVMHTGWITEWGATYYFNTNGTQATGWQTINGNLYYFNGQGVMATNTTIDGYTINANGVATKVNIGQEIANYAQEFVGSPYVFGANGPNSFDCSGFVQYVYKHFGYNLNRTTYEQVTEGTPVTPNVANLEPGDLIFFNVDGTNSHVGIYIGNGNFISAEKPGVGVQITPLNGPYWGPKISTARRIV